MEKTESRKNAEMFLSLSEKDGKFLSPVDLTMDKVQPLKLSKLVWQNISYQPTKMKLTNSGHTAILSGKWSRQRPHITGGPLLTNYVFSQLHFHWGANENKGSEHTSNGISYPMEMHVVFFKSAYLTQEAALKQDDGVVVLAYLFKVVAKPNPSIDTVINYLPQIEDARTSVHMQPVPLSFFVDEFTDDYLLYWGGVLSHSCTHTILWIISRQALGISMEQLAAFRELQDSRSLKLTRNFRDPHSLDSRSIYHVNPSSDVSQLLLPVISQSKKRSTPITVNCNYANILSLRKHFPLLKKFKAEQLDSKQIVNNFFHTDKLIFMGGTDVEKELERNILRILSQQLRKEVNDLDFERLDENVNIQNSEENKKNKRVKSLLVNQKKDIHENNVMQLEQAITNWNSRKTDNRDETDKSVKKFYNGDSEFVDSSVINVYKEEPKTKESNLHKQNTNIDGIITLYSNCVLNNKSYRPKIFNTCKTVYKTRSTRIKIAKERKLFENRRRNKHLEERRQKVLNYHKLFYKKKNVRNNIENLCINTCSDNKSTEVDGKNLFGNSNENEDGKLFDKRETLVYNKHHIDTKLEEVGNGKISSETNLTGNERHILQIEDVLNDFKMNKLQQKEIENEGSNVSFFGTTNNVLEENNSKLCKSTSLKQYNVAERKEFVSSNEEKENCKSRSDSMIKLKTDNNISNAEDKCCQNDYSSKGNTPGHKNASKKVTSLKNVNKCNTNYESNKSTSKNTENKMKIIKNHYEDDSINSRSCSIEGYRESIIKELEKGMNKSRSNSPVKFNVKDKIVDHCDETDSNNSRSSSVVRYKAFIKQELQKHISKTVKDGTYDEGRSNSPTTLKRGKNDFRSRSSSATRYREFIKQELMKNVKKSYEEDYLLCQNKSNYHIQHTSKQTEESSGTFKSPAVQSMINQVRQDKAKKMHNKEITEDYMSDESRSNSPMSVAIDSEKVQRDGKKYEEKRMRNKSLIGNVVIHPKENCTFDQNAINKRLTKTDEKNLNFMYPASNVRKALIKELGKTTTDGYTSSESRSNSPITVVTRSEKVQRNDKKCVNGRRRSRSLLRHGTITRKKSLTETVIVQPKENSTSYKSARNKRVTNVDDKYEGNTGVNKSSLCSDSYGRKTLIKPLDKTTTEGYTSGESTSNSPITVVTRNEKAQRSDKKYEEKSDSGRRRSRSLLRHGMRKKKSLVENVIVQPKENNTSYVSARNKRVTNMDDKHEGNNNVNKSSLYPDSYGRKTLIKPLDKTTTENYTSGESRSNSPMTRNIRVRNIREGNNRSRSRSKSLTRYASPTKKELAKDTTEQYTSGESRSTSPMVLNRNIRSTKRCEECYNNSRYISPVRYNKMAKTVNKEHTERRLSGESTSTTVITGNKMAINVDKNYGENSNGKYNSSDTIKHKDFVSDNSTTGESRSNFPVTINRRHKMVNENDDRFDSDLLRQNRTECLNNMTKTSRENANNENDKLSNEKPVDITANTYGRSKNLSGIKNLVDAGMQVDRDKESTNHSLYIKPKQIESDLEITVEKHSTESVEKHMLKCMDNLATDADKQKVNFNIEGQTVQETLNTDNIDEHDLNTIISKQIAEHPMFQIFNNIATKVFTEANNQGETIEECNVEDLFVKYILKKRTDLEHTDKTSETNNCKNIENVDKSQSELVKDGEGKSKETKIENKVIEVGVKDKLDGNVKLESSAKISTKKEHFNNLLKNKELVIQTNSRDCDSVHTQNHQPESNYFYFDNHCTDEDTGDEKIEEIICNQAVKMNTTYEMNSTLGQDYVRNNSMLSQMTQYSKFTDEKSTGRTGHYSGQVIQESQFTEKKCSNSSRPSSPEKRSRSRYMDEEELNENLHDKKSEEINLMIRKTIRRKSVSPKRNTKNDESDVNEFTYSTTQEYKAKVVSTFENNKDINKIVTDNEYSRYRSSSPQKLYEVYSNESLEDPTMSKSYFKMEDVALKSLQMGNTSLKTYRPVSSTSSNSREDKLRFTIGKTNPNDPRDGKSAVKSGKRSLFTSTTRNKISDTLSSSDVSCQNELREYRHTATPIPSEVNFVQNKINKIEDYVNINSGYGRVTTSSNNSEADTLRASSSTYLGDNHLISLNIMEEKTVLEKPFKKNENEIELKTNMEDSINSHDKLKTKIQDGKIRNNKNDVSKEKLKNASSNTLKPKVKKNSQNVNKLETIIEVNGSSILDSQSSDNVIKQNQLTSDSQGNDERTGTSQPIISAQANKPIKSKHEEKPIVKETKKPKFEFLKRQSKTFKPDNSFIKKIKNKDLLKNKFSYQIDSRISTTTEVDDTPTSNGDKKKFDYLKSRSKSPNLNMQVETMSKNRSNLLRSKIPEIQPIEKKTVRKDHLRPNKNQLAPIQMITFEPHEETKGNFKKVVYQPKKKIILKPNTSRRLKSVDGSAKIHQQPTNVFNSTKNDLYIISPDPNRYYSNLSDNYRRLTKSSRLECDKSSVSGTKNMSSGEGPSKIPRWKLKYKKESVKTDG